MYYVYIIQSESLGDYYKGSSSDVERRLSEHNAGKSRFTSGKGPWKLVFHKGFETKTEALIEEKRLKKLNHRSIEKLIHSVNQ